MNFLAHALLAGDAATDRVGGLMGDFIKGPLPAQLPPALAAGVGRRAPEEATAPTSSRGPK